MNFKTVHSIKRLKKENHVIKYVSVTFVRDIL